MLNCICMHPAIPHLLELQTADQRISALRTEIDSFPKRIREADLKLTGARNALAAAREANTHSLTERKKFELDVQQWKDRAKKYREQSGAVKTNEAYKALQHEITNAESEVAKAEDRQLEIMMGGEDSERRVKSAEVALKQAEQAIAAERKEIEAQQAAKKKALDAAVAEVTGVLDELGEIARGIHPAVLTNGGLRPALKVLARRSAVPVSLDVQVTGRLPESAEMTTMDIVLPLGDPAGLR